MNCAVQVRWWTAGAWDWSKGPTLPCSFLKCLIIDEFDWQFWWILHTQEGVEEDAENNNNEDVPDPLDSEEKEEQQPVERPRKTSKFMTKYERARILGTRALQIRFVLKNLVLLATC